MRLLRGLTLIELLVVISLLGLVLMTILGMMMAGLRVYERSKNYSQLDQHVVLAFETMRRDLHNTRRFKPVAYEGSYEQFQFPALIPVQLSDGTSLEEVGRVGYYLDSQHHVLCRSDQPYRTMHSYDLKKVCDPLVANVERIRFQYYLPDSSGSYDWTGSISSDQPPLAVKIEIDTTENNSREREKHATVIHLPTAQLPAPR